MQQYQYELRLTYFRNFYYATITVSSKPESLIIYSHNYHFGLKAFKTKKSVLKEVNNWLDEHYPHWNSQ